MSENKDIVDTDSKRKIYQIIILSSIILAFIGIFLASYYSSINKVYDSYETTLVSNINSINGVNKNIAGFNSNQTIDVDYAKEQLPNIIKDLSSFRSDLANSKPTAKYKKDHDNLISGLDKNKLVYMQVLGILNNPSGADVEKAMENLKTYRNDCMNFYSLISIHNIKIALPETALTFIDNVLNYSYSAVMIRKETDIKSQQIQEFISKTDSLSMGFLATKTNYYSYMVKIRKKEMSYDALLSLVEADLIKLSKVQTNFKSGLSIPPSGIPTYESLKSLLDLHETYLRDFKLALTSEKVQILSAAVDLATLDALYLSSSTKFTEVDNSYNNFIKVFTDLKNKE